MNRKISILLYSLSSAFVLTLSLTAIATANDDIQESSPIQDIDLNYKVSGIILQLKPVIDGQLNANADNLSLGPPGPWQPDTLRSKAPAPVGEVTMIGQYRLRLRVTLSSCERSRWLIIDEIKTRGRADSRSVVSSFRIDLYDIGQLANELGAEVFKFISSAPVDSIVWLSSTQFAWRLWESTVLFERLPKGSYRLQKIKQSR
jgi:hypothetical protein